MSPYRIEFTTDADRQLANLKPRTRNAVLAQIESQLEYTPLIATKNRKRLGPNPLAEWEPRRGSVRVLYRVLDDRIVVVVVAIGLKVGNKLTIEGEEVVL